MSWRDRYPVRRNGVAFALPPTQLKLLLRMQQTGKSMWIGRRQIRSVEILRALRIVEVIPRGNLESSWPSAGAVELFEVKIAPGVTIRGKAFDSQEAK